MAEYLSIPNKVALLFDALRRSDGKKFTLDEIGRETGVKPSTLSRIRSGENPEPMFRTVVALANAFKVRLAYFSVDMTQEEAEQYLNDKDNVEYLDKLALRQRQKQTDRQDRLVHGIALRAALLDKEGILAIADMIDFVLKKQGISPDELVKIQDIADGESGENAID